MYKMPESMYLCQQQVQASFMSEFSLKRWESEHLAIFECKKVLPHSFVFSLTNDFVQLGILISNLSMLYNCYIKIFTPKSFFAFSVIPWWWKALGIRAEGLCFRADFFHEVSWLELCWRSEHSAILEFK